MANQKQLNKNATPPPQKKIKPLEIWMARNAKQDISKIPLSKS